MEWADGVSQLITAATPLLIGGGGAIGWWIGRRDAKARTKQTEAEALKTVASLQDTTMYKNMQIERLEADYARSREVVKAQDFRLARKDERIAHLESLLDKRGAAS